MKSILQSIFDKISNIGIHQELPYFNKLRIKLLNRVALISLILSFYFLLTRFARHYKGLESIENYSPFFGILGVLAVWYFNSHQKFQYSKYFITIILPLFLFISYIYYGDFLKIDLAFLGLIVVNLLFYKSNTAKFFHVCYVVGLHLLGIFYLYHYGSIFTLGKLEYFVIDSMMIPIAIAMIIVACVALLYQEAQYNFQRQLQLNKKLIHQNKKLQTLISDNENKNQLFSILAHDLKDPGLAFHNLTKRVSYLLKNEPPEQLIETAGHFEKAGNKLFYTLDNLLNWTISQKEGIQPNPEKISLFELVKEIIERLNDFAFEKEVLLINHVNEDNFGVCDKNILSIVLGNILHNSIKFSYSKGEVIISSNYCSDNTVLNIHDFGKGIDQEMLEKLKNGEIISTQGTWDEKGYGLGLKSCFSLIEQINGKIIIESEKDKGTVFTLIIPNQKLQQRKMEDEGVLMMD